MFIYRALNIQNMSDYNNPQKNGIDAAVHVQSANIALDSIIPHIKSGSSQKQRDCWISTCKDIVICIREYAIPQAGKFCTANFRKNIAVIEIPHPNVTPSLSIKDNFTIFFDNQYNPVPNTFLHRFQRPNTVFKTKRAKFNFVDDQIQLFTNALSQASFGVFDCSMPSPNHNKKNISDIQVIQDKSLIQWGYRYIRTVPPTMDYFHHGVLWGVVNGYTTSITKNSMEVLCWNSIPKCYIKTLLTPLMQDIIYFAEVAGLGQQILDDFVNGNLSVSLSNINNSITVTYHGNVTNIQIKNPNLFGENPLYQLLSSNFTASTNIEQVYNKLIQQKTSVIASILGVIYPQQSFTKHSIPEANRDAVIIFDADAATDSLKLNKKQKYDLVAVKFNGNLYLHNGISPINKSLIDSLKNSNKVQIYDNITH